MLARGPEDDFYARLVPFSDFAGVTDARHYAPLPGSWWVALTDVVGSTRAVSEGRYKEVNALGACSIVATQHAAGGVDLPYVFGGDGATVLVPPGLEPQVRSALAGLEVLAEEVFGLTLRAGMVQMAELRRRGAEVLMARFQASPHVSLAMLSGGGVDLAEKLIKDEVQGQPFRIPADPTERSPQMLARFQCRWSPIQAQQGAVVSLLVSPRGQAREEKLAAVGRVVRFLESLAPAASGRPTSLSSLQLARGTQAFDAEARLKSGRARGLVTTLRRTWAAFEARVGALLMRWGVGPRVGGFSGRRYPAEVVANTDYRKFDDTLRMVLDLSAEQRARLERFLEEERRAGTLFYGLHVSGAALMTCFVSNYAGGHIHFVDGAEGGYALAAKQLKQQRADEPS